MVIMALLCNNDWPNFKVLVSDCLPQLSSTVCSVAASQFDKLKSDHKIYLWGSDEG